MLQQSELEQVRRRWRLALNRKLRQPVPPKPRNALMRASHWFFPYSLDTYPGQRKGFSTVLGVSLGTLRHILAGRREMSGETRSRLIEAMKARLDQGATILAELEAMPERPRKNPVTHINRKAASYNEQAAKLNK